MNNTELAKRFVKGDEEGKGNSMFIRGKAIFSFGEHFPIAVKLSHRRYLMNEGNYSSSYTSRHKSEVYHAITSDGENTIIYALTKELKDAISRDAKDVVLLHREVKITTESKLREAIEEYYKMRGINTLKIRNRANKFFDEMRRHELIEAL